MSIRCTEIDADLCHLDAESLNLQNITLVFFFHEYTLYTSVMSQKKGKRAVNDKHQYNPVLFLKLNSWNFLRSTHKSNSM